MVASIRDGYKNSELGIIPESWGIQSVDDVVSIKTGSRNTQDKDSDGIYPFFVRSQNVEAITSYGFDCEAVLTAGDGVGTGKIFHYINGKFDAHQRVYVMSDFSDDILGRYFYLVFKSGFYDRIMQMTAKSSVDSVRREMIADMLLRLPSIAEQTAIAEALTDADEAIRSLEAVIAKKRDVKQATLHTLLTPTRRLPGFSGEWQEKRLKELCYEISDGTHYTPNYVEHGVPFYSVENVTTDEFQKTRYITREEHQRLIKRCKPEFGDILMTRIGSIADTKLINWEVDASIYVSLALLKVNSAIVPDYLYAYTKTKMFITSAEDRSLLNAIPKKINMNEIGNIPIPVPARDEQIAIATILSDMDVEIESLETRLDKLRDIKQGMMQVLLTGKVRLI